MSVPGRIESAELLLTLDPPPWFLRHSRAVAEIAAWLARRIALRGVAIDRALVESAALLHDADKRLASTDPAGALVHGEGSAAWLARRGFGELSNAVAAHPVTRLIRSDPFADRRMRDIEARVVAYADKRAGQRLESLDARFASWQRRYPLAGDADPEGPHPDRLDAVTFELMRARAKALEIDVCATAGVSPRAVRRLRWTGAALAAARGRRGGDLATRAAIRSGTGEAARHGTPAIPMAVDR